MHHHIVPYYETSLVTKLVKDFFSGANSDLNIFPPIPTEQTFKAQLEALSKCFTPERRDRLYNVLIEQNPEPSEAEKVALNKIKAGAMTITTGHQLMIMGGPLFFEVKILNAVALARWAEKALGHPVVPIFWMATEDHDFEEISSFNLGINRFTWRFDGAEGPVGRLPVGSLVEQLQHWGQQVAMTNSQRTMFNERLQAYAGAPNLAEATRTMVRKWARDLGVLVIDGDDRRLKEGAESLLSREIKGEFSEIILAKTNELKGLGYKAQVTPRDVNLFSLEGGRRERMRLGDALPHDPLDISPNALLRPVYQEWTLPNLAYVGGGGELAYWLQLDTTFKHLSIPMPNLIYRFGLVLETNRAAKAMKSVETDWSTFLREKKEELIKKKVGYYTRQKDLNDELARPLKVAISQWKETLLYDFSELQTHADAIEKKMLKLSDRTQEVRFRALKKRESELLKNIDRLYQIVFPGGVFWERRASYLDIIGEFGEDPNQFLVDKMSTINTGIIVLGSEK